MKYDLQFRGEMELRDGTVLTLRAIAPSDKQALSDAFDKLSDTSRRSRFFTAKNRLSDEDLRFFTEVDGQCHYALVAVDESGAAPEGVGVARFVCTDDPQIVEIAIVVADAWQHRGVGKRLMRAIVEAAAERDVRHIKAITHAENSRLRKLMEPYGGSIKVIESSGGLVEIMIDLPQSRSSESFQTLYDLMRMVALGSIIVPVGIGRATIDMVSELVRQHKDRPD